MHSSELRGKDFKIEWKGESISHADFFADTLLSDRVAVVSPNRFEGIHAMTFVMAYVTSFYDHYRARGTEFRAYPDFFTLQGKSPMDSYGMFDIFPEHKTVYVPGNTQQNVEAITDRAVTILFVPDVDKQEVTIDPIDLESARRTIKRCFAYSESKSTDADLVIECYSPLLRDWVLEIFDSVEDDESTEQRNKFLALDKDTCMIQSFREIDLDEALQKI